MAASLLNSGVTPQCLETTSTSRRVTSPFDASHSNSRIDSDCGSSSGVGGMKTQEISDEGASSSSDPQCHAFFGRPGSLGSLGTPLPEAIGAGALVTPLVTPGLGTSGVGASGMMGCWGIPTPPGVANDIYVHVQEGEMLSILVGDKIENIPGPATVRLIGESGSSPTALPITVPPGHLIHQILDEQGILRHVILSADKPIAPLNYPVQPSFPLDYGNRHTLSQHKTQPFYTVNSSTHSHQRRPQWPANHVPNVPLPETIPCVSDTDGDLDNAEEREKLRDMLCRVTPPGILKVGANDVDVTWLELDTSEANAVGGPFPQIDSSEFLYHVVLFEGQRFVNNYKCDPNTNCLHISNLRPCSEYYVQLKIQLVERGINGEPSAPTFFKTGPSRPDAPIQPRISFVGADCFTVTWRVPRTNGCPVERYIVYLAKAYDDKFDKIWEGSTTDTRIPNLCPHTFYRVRVSAINSFGESDLSPPQTVTTRSEASTPRASLPNSVLQTQALHTVAHQTKVKAFEPYVPPTPQRPMILNSKSPCVVRLQWNGPPDVLYTVEMLDVAMNRISLVRDRQPGYSISISDLLPEREYRFRLMATMPEGLESGKSDWSVVPPRNVVGPPAAPSKPFVVGRSKRKADISWKSPQTTRDCVYHVEGSSMAHPFKFRTLYRGQHDTYKVTEDDIQNVRVQVIVKTDKETFESDYSDVLVLNECKDLEKAPIVEAPVIESVSRGMLRVRWSLSESLMDFVNKNVVFEVIRTGSQELVYSGLHTECSVDVMNSGQHIELQVRAVLVGADGSRIEGEYSKPGTWTAPRDAPRSPTDLRIDWQIYCLVWTQPDYIEFEDLRYRVLCCQMDQSMVSDECTYEVNERRLDLNLLSCARTYSCRVMAIHEEGESRASDELSFHIPAGPPAAPQNVSVNAESTSCLLLRWRIPDGRGKPVEKFRCIIENQAQVICEKWIPVVEKESNIEYRVEELLPDTFYRIELSGENEVGIGPSTFVSGKTKSLPPLPPKLEAESDSSSVRLRWKPPIPNSMLIYKVIRLGEKNQTSTVYEGEACTTRVRGLSEDHEHSFRIRCTDRVTGPGPWSDIFNVRTSLAPPPAVRSALQATPAGSGYCQLEWAAVISKPNNRRCFYRLQAVDCSIDNAKWHTVYEGQMSSYTLKVSSYPSAIQCRVLCVRPEGLSEVTSVPSPVVYIANNAETREKKMTNQAMTTVVEVSPVRETWGRATITSFVVVMFVVFSMGMALFCDQLFNLQAPSPSMSPSMPLFAVTPPPPREL